MGTRCRSILFPPGIAILWPNAKGRDGDNLKTLYTRVAWIHGLMQTKAMKRSIRWKLIVSKSKKSFVGFATAATFVGSMHFPLERHENHMIQYRTCTVQNRTTPQTFKTHACNRSIPRTVTSRVPTCGTPRIRWAKTVFTWTCGLRHQRPASSPASGSRIRQKATALQWARLSWWVQQCVCVFFYLFCLTATLIGAGRFFSNVNEAGSPQVVGVFYCIARPVNPWAMLNPLVSSY